MKHMKPFPALICLSIVCALAAFSEPAFAQNWNADARVIALGGDGGPQNLDTKMIDEQRDYQAIVLPIGLIQVFSDSHRRHWLRHQPPGRAGRRRLRDEREHRAQAPGGNRGVDADQIVPVASR